MPRRGEPWMALTLVMALGGCAGVAQDPVPAPLAPARTSYELLDRRQVVQGPSVPLGAGAQRLRSWITDDGAVAHHLLVTESYRSTGWRYYETAAAPDGTALRARSTDRRVGDCARISWLGCDHAEDVEVALPEDLLTAGAEQGLAVTVSARDGNRIRVPLSPQQIRAQLQAVAAARRGR
jgi:hypothetical protein